MNSADMTTQWLGLLGLLAGEIVVVALCLWSSQRTNIPAGWRRTFCQAAILCALLLCIFELSGSGRALADWSASRLKREAATLRTPHKDVKPIASVASLPGRLPTSSASVPARERIASSAGETISKSPGPEHLLGTGNSPLLESVDSVAKFAAGKSSHLVGLIAAAWLVGFIVCGARVLAARWLLSLLRRRSPRVLQPRLLSRIAIWSNQFGIRRRVLVLESERLSSPIVFGVFRATIGLPTNFVERYSETKREAMLAHELAHVAAHDPFWSLAADALTALVWWHPAVWWMRRQLQLSSELAADEASLLIADGPRALSECLVELGAQVINGTLLGTMRAGGFRSSLGCRIERLVQIEGRAFHPLDRSRVIVVKLLVPMALAAVVIVCSAWVTPQAITKGQTMKTKQIKRSLAALALMAAFSGFDTSLTLTQAAPAPGSEPRNSFPPGGRPPTAGSYPGAAGVPDQSYAPGTPAPSAQNMPPRGRMRPGDSERGARLENKLQSIVMEQVSVDGLPLSEVLQMLSEESRKRDSEKKGINFLINPNPEWNAFGPTRIDPTTGLPAAIAPSVEPMDVGATIVKFNLPLRHVTMKDVLDAIVKVADRPVDYVLEDYAVVFSLRSGAIAPAPMMQRGPAPEALCVQTFHVDTKSFAAGMETVFGIKLDPPSGKDGSRSHQVQAAMKELLSQLGITIEGNKTVFYNELTGVVMVRATSDEIGVVQAAMETLGGLDKDHPQPGIGFAPGGFPGGDPREKGTGQNSLAAVPTPEQDTFRRRYGLPPPGSASDPAMRGQEFRRRYGIDAGAAPAPETPPGKK